MFFANEQRETVREENPNITFGKLPSSMSIITSLSSIVAYPLAL